MFFFFFKFSFQTLWYIAPLSIQKMILFMQLAIKEQKLVVGGVFVPCLEGFATVRGIENFVNISRSYTLIHFNRRTVNEEDVKKNNMRRRFLVLALHLGDIVLYRNIHFARILK